MERRRYHRLYFTVPVHCRVHLQERQESWSSPGILKNLSLGGAYFVCDSLPHLRRGDVGEFLLQLADTSHENPLRAQGLVKRVDHHVLGFTAYGVAVEFLPPLVDQAQAAASAQVAASA
ncbi:MAG: PilZ domain-containing protein [Desulfobacca sp.]|uniref:PilZ domain-containing protein n=1 Tax=Desulfobacca sp. TaxID=2067990 RepID=UPI00404B286F